MMIMTMISSSANFAGESLPTTHKPTTSNVFEGRQGCVVGGPFWGGLAPVDLADRYLLWANTDIGKTTVWEWVGDGPEYPHQYPSSK